MKKIQVVNHLKKKQPSLIDPSECLPLSMHKKNNDNIGYIILRLTNSIIPNKFVYHHIDEKHNVRDELNTPKSIDVYGYIPNNSTPETWLGSQEKKENESIVNINLSISNPSNFEYVKLIFHASEQSRYLCIYKMYVYGNQAK